MSADKPPVVTHINVSLARQAFDKWYPSHEELYGTLGHPDDVFPVFEAGWNAAHAEAQAKAARKTD